MSKYFDLSNYLPKATNTITVYGNVITLSGTTTAGHAAYITINGIKNLTNLSYLTSTTVTAAAWVLANYDFYIVRGFKVANTLGVITVTPAHGWDTTNRINATITTVTGGSTLTGTLTGTFEPDGGKAKVWIVTFAVPTGIIGLPTRLKANDSLRILVMCSVNCSFSFAAGWPITAGVTPDIGITPTSLPYVIDRVNSATMLGGGQAGLIYYELGDALGQEITDEVPEEILVSDSVYIY